MPVYRYRSVEEMPPPWREADDARNLRAVAEMLSFYRRFAEGSAAKPGVRRLRNMEELNRQRDDPYRDSQRRT